MISEMQTFQLASWIETSVRDFCRDSPENSIDGSSTEPAWGEPLVAFARGDDPLFNQLKRDIGPFYWTPEEAFALACPEDPAPSDQLSVASWILPQTQTTCKDQRKEDTYPSRRWSLVRYHGEAFNCKLRLNLVDELKRVGIQAVAPERLPGFGYRHSESFGIASNWSERHTAFIAGLGTFGLSDGLITPLGKAMRCGSVVIRAKLPAAKRPYNDINAYCLWHAKGTCGACMHRCPIQAISDRGHDKQACFNYIREVTAPYAREHAGVEATPCGLCQVKIPCEKAIPAELREKHGEQA